ncbi:MAG TPA: acyltransferase domain-containing protein [Dongiaceae bacterium]|nr:acyltransferase domain-containing protein [Dongiaceae bacterium]
MLALLCGGQGRVSAEMFDLTADQPPAAPIFAAASVLLGEDPRVMVRSGSSDLLANRTNQLLSATATLAIAACIDTALPGEIAVTGYSVGEMAAWSIAGIWCAEAALRLTALRAQAMDAADGAEGQLGYVRGLTRARVDALAAQHNCAIAITNPGNLFVLGGARDDVAALCQAAEATGAVRAALLDVRIASHTKRLAAAVAPFLDALKAVDGAAPKPGRQLLAGGNGARLYRAKTAMEQLAQQVATPIDWATTLEALVERGVDAVLDLGPGHALADMMRGAFPAVKSYAADGFRTVEGLRGWIASGGRTAGEP